MFANAYGRERRRRPTVAERRAQQNGVLTREFDELFNEDS